MARFSQVYKTAEWDRSREFVIRRANGLCEECLRRGEIEAGREVDHIIPLTEENWQDWNIAYNPENLQYLCKPCHDIKHERATGLHRFVEPVAPCRGSTNSLTGTGGGPSEFTRGFARSGAH